MNDIGYYICKIRMKFIHGNRNKKGCMNKWLRKQGITIGEECSIFANIVSSEPYLITIGNNVTISNDVQLITHDNAIIKASGGRDTDVFGSIEIGDNCFIGAHAIIMPGVSICANTIVAAGSVVTRSVHDENTIIGGNPAVEISSWDKYVERNIRFAHNVTGMSYDHKKDYLLSDKDKIKIK